jgi:hypothetical protein
MKRGDRRTIRVDDKDLEAEFLGKGHYCTAYRAGDTVYCFVVEDEYMKEVISQWIENVPHIPAIRKHDDQQIRGKWFQLYSMPFYRNITAKDREAWAALKVLKESAERLFRQEYCQAKPLAVHGAYFNQAIIEDTRGKVPESVTKALEELASAAQNYGCGVSFEFGQRNIGVDDQGRIIFRDILFDAEKLTRERMAKLKRSRGW